MNLFTTNNENAVSINHEKICQYREETDCWKRILDFLQKENSYMKVRLTHLINDAVSKKLSENVKHLQHQLRQRDLLIASGRSSLLKFEKWLETVHPGDLDKMKDIQERRNLVLKEIEQVEHKFIIERGYFNQEMTKNL